MWKYNAEISVVFHILEESAGDKCLLGQFSYNEECTLANGKQAGSWAQPNRSDYEAELC